MSEANHEVVNADVPSKQEILVEPKTAGPQMDKNCISEAHDQNEESKEPKADAEQPA